MFPIRLIPRSTSDLAFILYYGMRILVFFAAAVFLMQQFWESAFYTLLIALAMIVPSVLKYQYRLFLPFELDLAIVSFIFVTLFLGGLNNFYVIFPWWDTLLHFSSGILIGSLGFVLVYTLNEQKTRHLNLTPGFISFFSFSFSLATGALWEIFEYGIDVTTGFPAMQGMGIDDTMSDLIVCAAGAAGVAIAGFIWMIMRQRVPFTPRLLKGFQYEGKHDVGRRTRPRHTNPPTS